MLRIQRILRIFPFEVIDLTKENRVSIAKHNDMNGKFCSLLLYKPKQSQLAIVFFSAVLGFRCCSRAFSSHGRQQLLQAWCVGFSLLWLLWLQSKGSRERALSSCGTWAQLPHGMWNIPRPGIELCPLHWQADSLPMTGQLFDLSLPPGKAATSEGSDHVRRAHGPSW